MDFGPDPKLMKILQQNQQNNQKIIEAAKVQSDCTAEQIAHYLFEEIKNFQIKLNETEDIAMAVVQFNQEELLLVDYIGYIGYNLIRFSGKDSKSNPKEIVQHVSQLNFLLTVVPKKEDRAEAYDRFSLS